MGLAFVNNPLQGSSQVAFGALLSFLTNKPPILNPGEKWERCGHCRSYNLVADANAIVFDLFRGDRTDARAVAAELEETRQKLALAEARLDELRQFASR